jgi:acylphosphatase
MARRDFFMETKEIIVKGKVQGVYFRASAMDVAVELGIRGTVCNMPDGAVKIIATGEPEALERMVEWCHRGPSRARVDEVSVASLPFKEFREFSITRE